MTAPWYQFITALWNRSGGGPGRGGAVKVVPVTTSPTAFTAPQDGTVVVAGGGVISITLTRGAAAVKIGQFYAPLPVLSGDKVEIAFVAAPAVTFIPM